MIALAEITVDSFAGGGGASLGIEWALGRSVDVAINHDAEAIALHAANHPDSQHYREDVWKVDPVEACAGRPVGLMWLSPDCKHFSKAKGGKPVSKRVRGLAWIAPKWGALVRPRVMVLENVEEFQTWGPLGEDNRPSKDGKGQTFDAFVAALSTGIPADHPALDEVRECLGPDFPIEKLVAGLGYDVQWRELRACDYGAPTIRKRLFLIARCDGAPIVWPKPTHGKGRPLAWHTAAECIEWSLPCPSIFLTKEQGRAIGVKRPLADPTMRRIARGVRRYVIETAKPFIVRFRGDASVGNGGALSIDEPLPTVTSNSFIKRPGGCAPLGIIVPTLIQMGYGERAGQAPRVPGLHRPLGTATAGGLKHALVAAFLAKHYTGVDGATLFEPVPTVTSIDHNSLVTSHLLKLRGTSQQGQELSEPAPTITGGGTHLAEVRAFLVAYYGNEKEGGSLFDPVRTVTSKERFGLVTVEGTEYVIADIGMRMLAARELYRAQGFPDSYRIDIDYTDAKGRTKPLSKTAQVRMVGNSVAPNVAGAIVAANVAPIPTAMAVA